MSARGGKKKGAKKKTPTWRCNWCQTSKTGRQRPGPDGPKTLCGTCNTRWGRGETGPRSDDWECDWCGADDSETPRRCKGPKGPGQLCWSCGTSSYARGATGPEETPGPAEVIRLERALSALIEERAAAQPARQTLDA